jgi:hypothetical protein
MPDNAITVRILADDSQFASVAKGTSNTVEEMGNTFRRSSGEVNRMGMEMARISAHVAGDAIPGFSRMSREIASLGAEAVGIGPLLSVMIPVGALVGGLLIMEKVEEAALKDKRAFAEWTEEGDKLNDKIMEEKEHLIGLVEGPMAEAIQKANDYKNTTSNLGSVIKSFDTELKANTSTWEGVATAIEKVATKWSNLVTGFTMGVTMPVPIDNTQIQARMADIKNLFDKTGQLNTALAAMGRLAGEVAAGGGTGWEDRVKSIEAAEKHLEEVVVAAREHQAALDEERKKQQEKNAIDAVDLLKDEVKRSKNLWDEKIEDATYALKTLEDLNKVKIVKTQEDPTQDVASINRTLQARLDANKQEAAAAQNLMSVKRLAAQAEAADEVEMAKGEAARKIAALAGDDREKTAKDTKAINEELASQILTINSTLTKDLEKIRADDLTQQQDYSTKVVEITVTAAKDRIEIARRELEELDTLSQEFVNRELERLQKETEQKTTIQNEALKKGKGEGPLFGSSGPQDKIYDSAIAGLDRMIASEKVFQSLQMDPTQVEKSQVIIDKMLDQQLQYAAKRKEIDDQIQQHNQQSLDRMTSAFNSNIQAWMQGSQTFEQGMIRTWVSMAQNFIMNSIKMGEQEVLALILHKTLAKQGILVDASKAATGAYAATSDIPIIGPELAPLAAAAAFAATVAFGTFEKGGISESGGLAMLHPKEMVLPSNLSQFMQRAAATAGAQAGGGESHVHNNHFNVGTINTASPADFMKQLKTMARRGQIKM